MLVKVFLIKNVPNIGSAGDVISIKKGFAINFIIKKGFGRIATPKDIRDAEIRAKQGGGLSRQKSEFLKDLKGLIKKKLVKSPITIKVKTTNGGKVYGSVSKDEVLQALFNAVPELKDFDEKSLVLNAPDRLEYTGKYVFDLTAKTGKNAQDETIPIFVDIVSISSAHLKSKVKADKK